jgi:hypothetical protein
MQGQAGGYFALALLIRLGIGSAKPESTLISADVNSYKRCSLYFYTVFLVKYTKHIKNDYFIVFFVINFVVQDISMVVYYKNHNISFDSDHEHEEESLPSTPPRPERCPRVE